uniref:NlpC/P60 family protein n=1 Tax=Biostraticola tofi TaxID=466109 RepID=UPI00104BDA17|nr:NlpC/P60 family protein [Biostraticola tofi]
MYRQEFIDKVMGIPWRNRVCSFEAADCWGLIVLYFRHVAGVEVHHSPNYEACEDFITCFSDEVTHWRSTDQPLDGGLLVGYHGSRPVHVGIVIGDKVLHSRQRSSSVRLDRLAAWRKIFTRLEFYSYADNQYSANTGTAEAAGDICGWRATM